MTYSCMYFVKLPIHIPITGMPPNPFTIRERIAMRIARPTVAPSPVAIPRAKLLPRFLQLSLVYCLNSSTCETSTPIVFCSLPKFSSELTG